MLNAKSEKTRALLLKGQFGLEKESLRITPCGHMAHTPHPFSDHPNIGRDFCENQIEINTPVADSAEEAVQMMLDYTRQIQQKLASLPEPELLWPFSNPPYIRNEEDIPIAQFEGELAEKTAYRKYLADRYGRYLMTFSGIHLNYSFSKELLEEDFRLSGCPDFRQYKDTLYLHLAKQAAAYGWVLTALTAASPILDSSYVEKHTEGATVFNGMASSRCAETGYWNHFVPVFDYTDLRSYVASIQKHVDDGLLYSPQELYYPIRLKPAGAYSLENLLERGVNHIELRMIDLNPLEPSGVNILDLKFAELFLVWLAALPPVSFGLKEQVQAVQNFKNAAHYDLKTVRMILPDGTVRSVADAGRQVLQQIKEFYRDFPEDVQAVLAFEEKKFTDADTRYAWIIRKDFADRFVEKGCTLAKARQK